MPKAMLQKKSDEKITTAAPATKYWMLHLALLPPLCHQFNFIATTGLPALRTLLGRELKLTSTAQASQLPTSEWISWGGF